MSGKIKLAAWLTITAPFFVSAFSGDYQTIGYGFAFTICASMGFLALADHLENVAARGVK